MTALLPSMRGWHLATALTTSARRRLRSGDHTGAAEAAGEHRESARLGGAADAIRAQQGGVRFRVYDADLAAVAAAARAVLLAEAFEAARAQGSRLSIADLAASS